MKTKTLASISVIALMAAMPAVANEAAVTKKDTRVERSSGDMSEDAKQAWKDIKEDTSEAYEEIKATLIGEESGSEQASLVIDSRKTATGLIGKPVYNERGESVAKVTDIILDESGKATMVVVADGEFIGMGKKAAFDYGAITRVEVDGDVVMPLTEEMISNAASFSYDAADAGDANVRVIPANAISVAELLDGQVLNTKNEAVADIDNISLKNGRADKVIVSFDKVLGLGGQRAAMNFSDAKIIRDGDDLDFQLTANQANQFETYRKTATN